MNDANPADTGGAASSEPTVDRVTALTDAQLRIRNQAANEDDDPRTSLAGLSQLATAQMELTDALTRVAEYAVLAIPGADGAGPPPRVEPFAPDSWTPTRNGHDSGPVSGVSVCTAHCRSRS